MVVSPGGTSDGMGGPVGGKMQKDGKMKDGERPELPEGGELPET